ncbi:hypothetical protein, partial [Streptomyces sp. SID161]|uniref:hypothetical protein n=1 Tax=Streptomyces sp. SID161 TaxID=2690251 RepID=UPI001F26189D
RLGRAAGDSSAAEERPLAKQHAGAAAGTAPWPVRLVRRRPPLPGGAVSCRVAAGVRPGHGRR